MSAKSLLLVCFTFLVAGGTAMARSSGNANACTANYADLPSLGRHHLYGIYNSSSTQEITVYCPVEYNSDDDGVNNRTLRVTAYDRNTSKDVSCTLYGLTEDGSQTFYSPSAGTIFSSSGAYTIRLNLGPTSAFNQVLVCSIPRTEGGAFSHIVSYGWFSS